MKRVVFLVLSLTIMFFCCANGGKAQSVVPPLLPPDFIPPPPDFDVPPPLPPGFVPPPPPAGGGEAGPGRMLPGGFLPPGAEKPSIKRKVPPGVVAGKDYVAGQMIIKFKKDLPVAAREEILMRKGTCIIRLIPQIDVQLIELPPQASVPEFVDRFNAMPEVMYAEPNYIGHIAFIPNDPLFPNQWGLHNTGQTGGTPDADIDAPEAWDITLGSATIKIAILDSGIDPNHDDLSSKVIASANCVTGTDTCGSNPSSCTPGPAPDDNDHGTEVAGIAAAMTNNGIGIAGAGGNSTLINVKVSQANGDVAKFDSANGIIWAADNGASVINMSYISNLPTRGYCQAEQDAVNYAWNEKGAILVAGAGNEGDSLPSYPAAYDNVIAVAATNQNDVKIPISNYGDWVDLAAPGHTIWTTLRGNGYGIVGPATSYATPFVSGVVALIRSIPAYNNKWLALYRVLNTADQIPETGNYWKYGRVNAWNAVKPPNSVNINSTKATYGYYNYNNPSWADTNFGNDVNIRVGLWYYVAKSYSYIEHSLGALPAGARITYGGLWVYISNPIGFPGWAEVHAVTQSWIENTLTWNNKPTSRNQVESWAYLSGSPYWQWFDITSLIAEWKRPSANLPNYGLALIPYDYGPGMTQMNAWLSSDDAPGYVPQLYIEYVQ